MSKRLKMPTDWFDPNAVCCKCGNDDITTRYCEEKFDTWSHGIRIDEPHIHRNCRRCHFEWLEWPLDSERERGDA
jgi:hypothetical protein